MFNIYVTNLAKYNQGISSGKWLELPMDEDELQMELKLILGEDEEYAIHDYEAPFHIGEYESISRINEIAEEVERSGVDSEVLDAIAGALGSIFDAIETVNNGDYHIWEAESMEEVARQHYEETGMVREIEEKLPHLVNHIDYESIGQEMDSVGTYIEFGKKIIQINN
ncbi:MULTISPECIES: antirestriction protein ArdA [unclassified Exiguobacterium]|uniref:antirestriction protein ArdA n=1 Tax=unclassified Exiguobacterium TaxID=2644629 RepID=UPI001BE90F32|nr:MULTISPECIES: antirestriction protein ArdA [unclassified Exiguobacterium]